MIQKKINLTIDEVAQWLDVNSKTVYRLLQRHDIPGFKVGGQWRVNQDMLKDWMHSRVHNKKTKK